MNYIIYICTIIVQILLLSRFYNLGTKEDYFITYKESFWMGFSAAFLMVLTGVVGIGIVHLLGV